jgi:hypothetical protein|tara:strand:+ start:5942 stop:6394 length:453 start_codon:yes stop_codon:yes gene_type:complete
MLNKIAKMSAKGKLHVALYGPDGALKEERLVTNVVVDDGLDYIASRVKDASATAMSHMACGSNATAAAAGNSALGTELGRVALTSTTVTNASVQYIGDFPAGTGTGAVVEAGILNASSGGTLLCRTVFAVVNKGAADTLKITWTVTVADS